MSNHIYVGLVHYPIYNKKMETITTSVTNLDIHDIARCTATYNVEKYYLINPLPTQHQLVQEIITYWQQGYGAAYNPDRKAALDRVAVKESLEKVKAEIIAAKGPQLFTIVTDAKLYPTSVSYSEMREKMATVAEQSFLLLFGTGWGLTREIREEADYVLEPVYGSGSYNHLSVRSAAAIILDRLLGKKWWK
jgi:hypothetical protein